MNIDRITRHLLNNRVVSMSYFPNNVRLWHDSLTIGDSKRNSLSYSQTLADLRYLRA